MKKFLTFTLTIITVLTTTRMQAQKQVWSVIFPGYDMFSTHGTLSDDNSIDLFMLGGNGLPDKYACVNKFGQVTYQQNGSVGGLSFIKDNSGNHYQISYLGNQLLINKYDLQGSLVWNQSFPFTPSVFPLDSFEIFSSATSMFHSNGSLIVSARLTDVNDFDIFSINPSTGTINFHYEAASSGSFSYVVNTVLQEDSLGNINCLAFDWLNAFFGNSLIAKLSATGAFLQAVNYSNVQTYRTDKNSIYLGNQNASMGMDIVKLNINSLDTLFYVSTSIDYQSGSGVFDGTDSALYCWYSDLV